MCTCAAFDPPALARLKSTTQGTYQTERYTNKGRLTILRFPALRRLPAFPPGLGFRIGECLAVDALPDAGLPIAYSRGFH